MFKDTVLQAGYPKDIAQFGHGMPAQSIETAVWWEDVAKTYFFKGDRWVQLEEEEERCSSQMMRGFKEKTLQEFRHSKWQLEWRYSLALC